MCQIVWGELKPQGGVISDMSWSKNKLGRFTNYTHQEKGTRVSYTQCRKWVTRWEKPVDGFIIKRRRL